MDRLEFRVNPFHVYKEVTNYFIEKLEEFIYNIEKICIIALTMKNVHRKLMAEEYQMLILGAYINMGKGSGIWQY